MNMILKKEHTVCVVKDYRVVPPNQLFHKHPAITLNSEQNFKLQPKCSENNITLCTPLLPHKQLSTQITYTGERKFLLQPLSR